MFQANLYRETLLQMTSALCGGSIILIKYICEKMSRNDVNGPV